MRDDGKVKPLRLVLFSPGEITITPEAFQSLKDVGLRPSDLIGRHIRGDWDGAPVKWMVKNEESLSGGEKSPIMSVYQLHPTETRICVGTTIDHSGTSVTVWPRVNGHGPLMPVDMAERVSQQSEKGQSGPVPAGKNIREIFEAWGKDKQVTRTREGGKGPTRYGPSR